MDEGYGQSPRPLAIDRTPQLKATKSRFSVFMWFLASISRSAANIGEERSCCFLILIMCQTMRF